jgi:peptidoglycan/xylan/chitin deacetylase (PgdA/CDA1 family)
MHKIKKKLDKFVTEAIGKLGPYINPLLLKLKSENKQLLIFYFHGLFDSLKQKELYHIDPQHNMLVSQFDEFIDYFLNHGYKFIKSEDLLTLTGIQENQRYAMITFDDGYFNNMPALEITHKYKIPAIYFISTRNIIENKSYWWDIVYKYRHKQGNSHKAIGKEQSFLKGFKHSEIEKYIIENFGIKSFEPWSDIDRPFSPDEVKYLSESPFSTIGNHTHNHAILTNYEEEGIKEDIMDSNKILFELTGKLPKDIAFPNGNYNKLILELTESLGFRFAFTTEPGKNLHRVDYENLTCLNRFMTTTDNIKDLGSFYRLGSNPNLSYLSVKGQMTSLAKAIIVMRFFRK